MKKHTELLGILYIAFNTFHILIALIVFIILTGIGFFASDMDYNNSQFQDFPAPALLTTIAIFVLALITILSIPGIIGGYAILKRYSWSRILLLILGCFNLLNLPFGTALGVYTLWVLLQDETVEYLSGESEAPSKE